MDKTPLQKRSQEIDRSILLNDRAVNPLAVLIALPLVGIHNRMSQKTKKDSVIYTDNTASLGIS
jgi:hypothetical protein